MSIIDNTRAYKIKRIRQLIARTELYLIELEEKIAKLQTRLANRRVKLGYLKAKYSGDLDQLPDAEFNQLYTTAEDMLSYTTSRKNYDRWLGYTQTTRSDG